MGRQYRFVNYKFGVPPLELLEIAKRRYFEQNPPADTENLPENPFGICILYFTPAQNNTVFIDVEFVQGLEAVTVAKRPGGFVVDKSPVLNTDIREFLIFDIPPYKGKFYYDFIIYILDVTTQKYWATSLVTEKICYDKRYYMSKVRKKQYADIGKSIAGAYTRTFMFGHVNLKSGKIKQSSGINRLKRHGWIPTISLLPYPYAEMINIIESTDDIQKVDEFAEDFFKEDVLDKILDNWIQASLLSKRESIFKTAFTQLKESDYISALYLLIPQIEELITHHIKRNNLNPEYSFKGRIKQFEKVITDESYKTQITKYLTKQLCSHLYKVFFKAWKPFTERVRRSGTLRSYRISKLAPQRHVILHGEYNEKYFTKANCLKIISILDAIIMFSLKKNELPTNKNNH